MVFYRSAKSGEKSNVLPYFIGKAFLSSHRLLCADGDISGLDVW